MPPCGCKHPERFGWLRRARLRKSPVHYYRSRFGEPRLQSRRIRIHPDAESFFAGERARASLYSTKSNRRQVSKGPLLRRVSDVIIRCITLGVQRRIRRRSVSRRRSPLAWRLFRGQHRSERRRALRVTCCTDDPARKIRISGRYGNLSSGPKGTVCALFLAVEAQESIRRPIEGYGEYR